MSENIFFTSCLILLFMHELDAIRCKEWRIFPGLSYLSDKKGRSIFLFAHIPLLLLITWGLVTPATHPFVRNAIAIFTVIHALLHILYLKNPRNLFKDRLSWILIILAALSGLLELFNQYSPGLFVFATKY